MTPRPGLVRTAITLEQLLTHPQAFGLTTASPLQRAICRIADGLPLGDLADVPEVRAAIGDISALPASRPDELAILSVIRTGKSLFAAALAVRASQTCDLSKLGPGETARVSVLSLTTDLGRVVFEHLVGHVLAKPVLKALLIGEPTADSVMLRHPSGRPVEIKVVAGSRAGASLVARWSGGCIADEAPRMLGEDDGVINFDHMRRSVLGRLLPGAQLVAIGSPWAPRGPIYEMVQEHAGKPSARLVIIKAPAHHMNPMWWTPEKIEKLRTQDATAHRTDVLAEFADPESSLFSSMEIEKATRATPLELPFEEGHSYGAAMDPGTRGNAWTFVLATVKRDGLRMKKVIVLAKQWIGSKTDPLSPDVVLKEIASICKRYKLDHVRTDQCAADALRDIAGRHDIGLIVETITAPRKVELYEGLRTRVADGEVELPPDLQIRADLLSVRKVVTQNGIGIVLPRTADGRHADYAPAIALVVEKYLGEPEAPELKPGSRQFYEQEQRQHFEKHLARLQGEAAEKEATTWGIGEEVADDDARERGRGDDRRPCPCRELGRSGRLFLSRPRVLRATHAAPRRRLASSRKAAPHPSKMNIRKSRTLSQHPAAR
jgi:hypothetical protein